MYFAQGHSNITDVTVDRTLEARFKISDANHSATTADLYEPFNIYFLCHLRSMVGI